MKDKLFVLKTDTEHGLTDSRIKRCISSAIDISEDDSRLIIQRTAKGKPVLPYANLHVSVSHSGGVWACYLSEQCVGLDIQIEQKCSREKIANRYFHEEEKEWLQSNMEDFFRIWCIKESYVKYIGEGISMGMDIFSVIKNNEITDEIGGVKVKSFMLEDNLHAAVCGGQENFEIIEFFE